MYFRFQIRFTLCLLELGLYLFSRNLFLAILSDDILFAQIIKYRKKEILH